VEAPGHPASADEAAPGTAPDEQATARADQLVVHLKWTEADGTERHEMFGPWTPVGDDSHLGRISAFMRDWKRLVGDGAQDAVMWAVQDPDEWVRQREGSDEH
jgi:hypothetical protein